MSNPNLLKFTDALTIEHPVFSADMVILTEPIKELYQIVRHVLLVRETGCCFSAESGVGKTRALQMLSHLLKSHAPELVIVEHTSWNHQVSSIRAFFKHFLTAIGHPELRGETFDLRNRLVLRLSDLARTSHLPFIVLLIDEANALRLADFLFLKDIYNDLDREGIQMTTVMMGQEPDFSYVIADLREQGRLDLVSRFARRHTSFRAYSTQSDIEGILEQYDTATYPAGSDQTWTRYFLPHAWDEGYRFINEASSLLDAVKICTAHSTKAVVLPARQLFTAIRRYLVQQSNSDAPGVKPKVEAWKTALEYALLADATMDTKREAKRSIGRKR